ncbi:uncharacterized protein [Amphiura filiformis]|uniref:uncharacterized protein isoform X1 n=1 Tax=Amphiura filiformis TaxID=82378 RepID=UPI003B20EAE3
MPAATEMPGVNAAIQHLLELKDRMMTSEFTFKEPDLEMVDDVADAIKELDDERVRVHTLLETETINASVLRHRLHFLPARIQKEIAAAVESARHSNTEELKNLNGNLKELNEEIESVEARKESLIKENAVLHPERDMVRAQHEEVISQLNQRMADKASKQITLNETRDTLRDTNQKIVDLETQVLILKEDMIQERADARQEKKRLKQAVHDTTKRTKKQKEANISKKKELDKLHEQLVHSEHELSEIRKSIRRYETSKARYDSQEETFQAQLDNELKENKILKDKGFDLGQNLLNMEKRNNEKQVAMETNLKDLETQIINATTEYDKLIDTWTRSKRECDEAMTIREEDAQKVSEVDKVLQDKKRELSKKAGDTARMKQENDEMEYRMKQLEENHLITVQLLEKSITDFRDALTKERKERTELQEKRDALTREIDSFKMSFSRYMNELNRRIDQAKQDQIDLTKEGGKLKIDIRSDDAKIKALRQEQKEAQFKFDEMKTGLETRINTLQDNIVTLEKTVEVKMKEIEGKTPDFEALEKLYIQRMEEYERTKKEIVKLKNQKSSLIDQSQITKKEIVKLTNPTKVNKKPKTNKGIVAQGTALAPSPTPSPSPVSHQVLMQQELRSKRKKALGKMREQTKELTEIEEKIYHAGRKLRSVIEENEKFKLSIDRMNEETEALKAQKILNARLQEALKNELLAQRGQLKSGWVEDRKMQDTNADRDRLVLEDITEIMTRTEEREAKVSDITEKLSEELVLLTAFLENVAHRKHEPGTSSRPSTTASSLRPPTILQDYLESRTMLNTQESRAEAISRVRSKMFEKKEDEELVEEGDEEAEKESFADTAESELRWADPVDDTPAAQAQAS